MSPVRWAVAAFSGVIVCLIASKLFSRQTADSTAQGVALMRGVGWHSPDPFLRINDAASLCFVSRSARLILSTAFGASTVRTFAGLVVPGAYEQVVYRTHHYDKLITDSVANGARQVVIMGAGYVTYGHRLQTVVDKGVPVFELDLPAIQEQKLARLDACVADGLLTRNSAVRHTPIDFAVQTVGDALREAGFDVTLPSVFIWEGVSMYVPESGVRETLRSVRSVAAPGSAWLLVHLPRNGRAGWHV